jgi:hypothetical protein
MLALVRALFIDTWEIRKGYQMGALRGCACTFVSATWKACWTIAHLPASWNDYCSHLFAQLLFIKNQVIGKDY